MEKHSQKEGPYGFCEGGRISNRSRVFPPGNPGQSSLPGLCTPHRAQSPPNSAFALCRVLNHLPLTSFLLWKESPGFRDPTEPAWGAAQSPPSAGHGLCVGDKAVTAPQGQFMDTLGLGTALWAVQDNPPQPSEPPQLPGHPKTRAPHLGQPRATPRAAGHG